MPGIVNIPAARKGGGVPRSERRRKEDIPPTVDWTGHAYKAVSQLRIDYTKTGRDRAVGRRDVIRTYPVVP